MFSEMISSTAASTSPVSAGVNPASSACCVNHSSLSSNSVSVEDGPSSQSLRAMGTSPSRVMMSSSRACTASVSTGHGTFDSSCPVPSARSARVLSRIVEAHALAGTDLHPHSPPSAPIIRISSISELRIASIWFWESSRFCSRSRLCSVLSGKLSRMPSQCSIETFRIGMSVSGYIRAPPGSGLIAVVVPSAGCPFLITTLRTSRVIL